MPWAALIGVGISAYMGNKAAKRQRKAQNEQGQLGKEQIELGREQLDFGKQQYSDWQAKFDPAYQAMLNEMDQGLNPNFGMIAGDVKSSFQSARGSELRDMQRYGINPMDGGYRNMSRQYGINEAAAHVGARSQAREATKGLKFQRLANNANMLVGMQGIPSQTMNTGYGNLSNAYGNNANMVGQQGIMNYNMGMQDAYGAGAMAGGLDWGALWGDVKGWFGNTGSGNSFGAPSGGYATRPGSGQIG